MAAKSEAAPKSAKAAPSKPRLRFIKELMLLEALSEAGSKAVFQRSKNCVLVADLDSQFISIDRPGKDKVCIPFSRCKHWTVDVGVPPK